MKLAVPKEIWPGEDYGSLYLRMTTLSPCTAGVGRRGYSVRNRKVGGRNA